MYLNLSRLVCKQGFPEGELGKMMHIVHEIKTNGLEYLFEPLRPNQ